MKLTVAVFYVKLHMESSMQNNCRKIRQRQNTKAYEITYTKQGAFSLQP